MIRVGLRVPGRGGGRRQPRLKKKNLSVGKKRAQVLFTGYFVPNFQIDKFTAKERLLLLVKSKKTLENRGAPVGFCTAV